jgi:hypothetical protein
MLREPQHERHGVMTFKYLAVRPETVEGRMAIFSHDHEVAWFDKLTMSGSKPLTLRPSKGSAPSEPPR